MKLTLTSSILTFALLATLSLALDDDDAVALPRFSILEGGITVSGISAGACFATQFHVAYSSIISGMGSWAGIPYLCYAHDHLLCMTFPSGENIDTLIRDTDNLAGNGDIDPTDNLADDLVYIFHGTRDTTVFPGNADNMEEYYINYLSDSSSQIKMKTDIGASHAVVSDHYGSNCGISDGRLYIENCDFDSVFDMMDHINGGGLNPAFTPGTMTGRLLKFDQEEFFQSASGASMEDFGFVYIPPACEDGSLQCRLHVFFHGCTMQHQVIGTDFITNAGFIEIADANNIVVLFPQTIAKTLSGNPNGCFNWFGYLNDLLFEDFGKKDAVQMKGVYDMIVRAAGL